MGRKRKWTTLISVILVMLLALGLTPSRVYGDTESIDSQDEAVEFAGKNETEYVIENISQEVLDDAEEFVPEEILQTSNEEQLIIEINEEQIASGSFPEEEELELEKPALTEPTVGIVPLGVYGNPPSSIVARVTLYPPSYGRSITNPANFGYFGNEWYDIRNNGFTASYNHVEIISGYSGNDWLYGAYGTAENNAAFTPNNTVICIDAGDTPPSPGGNNTRDVTMNYIQDITYSGQQYYLYWGAVTFNYETLYSYGNGPQRMGTFIALPKEFGDPVVVMAYKQDEITRGAYGQDDPMGSRLEGAQFTVRFWENQYYDSVTQAEAVSNPTRTWVIETLAGGAATLLQALPGSDALYLTADGDPTLPLGTVIIQETVAPDGYLLPNPNIPSVQQIRYDSTLNIVIAYNPIVVIEQPRIVEVEKYDAVAGIPLDGAEYRLMRESALGAGDWTQLYGTKITGVDGKANWSPVPSGSYRIVEVTPPTGYQLPSAAGDSDYQSFIIDISDLNQQTTVTFNNYAKPEINVLKIDADTTAPIEDTEFTLYVYPGITIENGNVIGDTTSIHQDNTTWAAVGTTVTDADGKLVFPELPFGYYMLRETRANPAYASYEELGGVPRFITIDKNYTGEIQVFEDELIRISVEVYKKTIRLTSSALDSGNLGNARNVGIEEYTYSIGARSTSNVAMDEFVIVDDLTGVTNLGYRLTKLWTGTSPAGLDYDGMVAVLYRTNMTSANEQPSYGYNPLSANPTNPNNQSQTGLYSNASGWRIWAEGISVTDSVLLYASVLGLQENEYITGLMFVYGGVDIGFYTGAGFDIRSEPNTIRSGDQSNIFGDATALDWMYSVVATQSLRPIMGGSETIMRGSVQALGSRNGVLTDSDYDAVETRVIEPFALSYPSIPYYVPKTGDSWFLYGLSPALIVLGLTLLAFKRKKGQGRVAYDG